ncbi:MAG: WbqC family protein [Magnetococcales bacterium]|nr:WbqC family protein [Magnetococcales bacterium]MBF0151066.1 WbqC family protein [Magnetococcales bacterium]
MSNDKIVAVMQPYLFPYVGYWQLVSIADCFIVYDDVNFIKKGWVHRNRILINGKPFLFTVPLRRPSQNVRICDTWICSDIDWRGKLLKMIQTAYRKRPFYHEVFPIVEEIIMYGSNHLSDFLLHQLHVMLDRLKIHTHIVNSSLQYHNSDLKGMARIIDICKHENASVYVNLTGGMSLYDPESFKNHGIDLRFVEDIQLSYDQIQQESFISRLSIIDVLMHVGFGRIGTYLDAFRLINPSASSMSEIT